MMMRYVVILLFCTSCTPAAGVTEKFPRPLAPESSATITVFQKLDGAVSPVLLDGFRIGFLRSGTYFTFSVPPGTHAIGTAGPASITLDFRPGVSYYFTIHVSPGAFAPPPSLGRITEAEARERFSHPRTRNITPPP